MRALVIEGGSMRATYANGVLMAFEEAGERGWDAVYGTSAGGALAAWYAAGQAKFASETWKYAADRRFISWRRFARGGPLLDHDRLYTDVYAREHPLDVEAVERAEFPVYVTVTDAGTGLVRYVDLRRGPVLAWLRATGRLPVGSGSPVEVEGKLWLDGGLVDPIPVVRAIQDGATELVAILNRPPTGRKPEHPLLARLVAAKYPHLAPLVEQHHDFANRAYEILRAPPKDVRVSIVAPRRDTGVGRFTRDVPKLDRAIRQGFEDGRAWLAAETGIPVEVGP